MTTNKEATLKKINKEFSKISNLTLEQLEILRTVLAHKEHKISKDIVKKIELNEQNINKLDSKLDDHIIKAIVLYKPVASELRHLFAIYRIVQNLERIADRVIKIANLKQKIKDIEMYTLIEPKLNFVFNFSYAMLRKSLDSFKMNNEADAFSIIKDELILDDLNKELVKIAMKEIEQQADIQTLLESITNIRAIISSIDRIVDHAKNIAEASIYSQLGKNYTHQKIDED